MRVLVDTNVLIRLASPADPLRELAVTAMAALVLRGHRPCLTPQNYYEYWVVATRPHDKNGLGLPIEKVAADLEKFDVDFDFLPDFGELFQTWREIVVSYRVSGKLAHDARLAAAMLRHGVTHLLTFNAQDFARFKEITAIPPASADSLTPQD